MELKIVEFIKTHSNWEELLTSSPYNLTVKRDGKLILFKYNQIDSDFNEEICCEARGLILEEGTWKVVRFAFKKFFNLGEKFAAKIDWDSATSSEKLDGSIISVFFYDGQWRVATNNTIDAFKAPLNGVGPYKNFGELFTSVMPLDFFEGEHFGKNWADLNLCFTFELVSPYNKVVIDYPETKVYLLSMREMDTLNEIEGNVVRIFGKINGFNTPQEYKLRNEKEFCELVESMSNDHEGIVVRDMYNERVKIKTKSYFELHRMVNNGVVTVARMVELIRANDHEEFLAYFNGFRDEFSYISNVMEKISNRIDEISTLVKQYSTKKEIALDETIPNWEKRFYFNAFDKKENNLETKDWCKLISIWEEIHNERAE